MEFLGAQHGVAIVRQLLHKLLHSASYLMPMQCNGNLYKFRDLSDVEFPSWNSNE